MERILAWREQVAESGDISPRSRAILAAALAGKPSEGRKRAELGGGETAEGRRGPREQVRVGTALVREHASVLHRVTVTPDGFAWEGRTYASLSAVARAITGVRWNGHRFFGLDRGARPVGHKARGQGSARAGRATGGSNDTYQAAGGEP